MAGASAAAGDVGSNDLIVSQVIRTNELQAWVVSEHMRGAAEVAPRPASAGRRGGTD